MHYIMGYAVCDKLKATKRLALRYLKPRLFTQCHGHDLYKFYSEDLTCHDQVFQASLQLEKKIIAYRMR